VEGVLLGFLAGLRIPRERLQFVVDLADPPASRSSTSSSLSIRSPDARWVAVDSESFRVPAESTVPRRTIRSSARSTSTRGELLEQGSPDSVAR
jgi:hypothetical protein